MNKSDLAYSEPNKYKTSTIVFVTDQMHCENLIKTGRKIADIAKNDLYVINIQCKNRLETDAAALEHLYGISRTYGATMQMMCAESPLRAMISCAKKFRARHVLTGAPNEDGSVLYKLWASLPVVHFYVQTPEGKLHMASRYNRCRIAL